MKLALITLFTLFALATADCGFVYYSTPDCADEAGVIRADGECHTYTVVESDDDENDTYNGSMSLSIDESGDYVTVLCNDEVCGDCFVAEPDFSEQCEETESEGIEIIIDGQEVKSGRATCEL